MTIVLISDEICSHVERVDRPALTRSVAVTEPGREPLDGQQPRPTLLVLGETAYVTEPDSAELHVVDLHGLEVEDTIALPQTPNELNGVAG